MTQPAEKTIWATNEVDLNGELTKVSPPIELQQSGYVVGQPVARVWLNYQLNYLTSWVNDPFPSGFILTSKRELISDEDFHGYGGVASDWTSEGTGTLNSSTVYYYSKD